MSSEMMQAIESLVQEKGITKEEILELIEQGIVSAYKRNYNQAQNVRVAVDFIRGDFQVYSKKDVVEQVFDSRLEISLDDALKMNPHYQVGDTIEVKVTPRDFGRVAAASAKQVVTQRIREAERDFIYNQYIDRVDDIITAIVQRRDARNVYVSFGSSEKQSKFEATLPASETIATEAYDSHSRMKVYITRVDKTSKGPVITVSRTHPGLLKRLFEIEVPEIYDGTVEIKSIAREAGDRSKISVYTELDDLDPVGACVGPKGKRVQDIVDELGGEKIDIVRWSKDPVEFVANALSPSEVLKVMVNEEEKATTVVVPDHQLSLAIGKRGQNARLAAKLTGWKIDIKSETDARALGLYTDEDVPLSDDLVLNLFDKDDEFDF
ncbi:MAG: transcription termination factor NusA [Bacilli bacterium]